MKKILYSLLTIAMVGGMAIGATSAVFTSQATVENNTFATGTLEIRVNGQPTIAGFTAENMAPGQCTSGKFTVNNYGQPWFAGPSTLPANTLNVSALNNGGSLDLYNKLHVKIDANRGWSTAMTVFDGQLKNLTNKDLLNPRWASLNAGDSEEVFYEVCLPSNADNSYMGLSTTFNWVLDAQS